MHGLSELEFARYAQPQLLKICKPMGVELSNTPFTRKATDRILLLDYRFPEGEFLGALKEYSRLAGEPGAFVSLTEYEVITGWDQPFHWYVPYGDIQKIEKIVAHFEHVMYSVLGTWAIVGRLDYGLLAGPAPMLDMLKARVPDLSEQVEYFLDTHKEMKENIGARWDVSWIPGMLAHVYGSRKATMLIQQSGLLHE